MIQHIYPGVVFETNDEAEVKQNWSLDYNERYLDLLSENRDQVILEVAGHDHVLDIRYSHDEDGKYFRNLLIAPGITASDQYLPGFATFKVSNFIPKDLKGYFLDITKTYGMTHLPSLDELSYSTVNYRRDYGLKDLTPHGIKNLISHLSKKENL